MNTTTYAISSTISHQQTQGLDNTLQQRTKSAAAEHHGARYDALALAGAQKMVGHGQLAGLTPPSGLPPTAPPTPLCETVTVAPPCADDGALPPRISPRRIRRAPLIPPPPPHLPIYSGSFTDNFRAALADIDLDMCEENGENAFYVCDLGEVYRQATRWHRVLSNRVEAFFAVKCNPDPQVLRLLAALGMGFDCASHSEIALILSLGVDPSRIIYANPCKAASFVRHAHAVGVDMMTFDNSDELEKVSRHHPTAKMVLRILTDDSGSLCRFGDKFGAPLAETRSLLEKAKALNVEVVGVSFHVGSGCTNPDLYRDAISRAKYAFGVAAELGFKFDFLDVGGGFGDDNFERLAEGLIRGLDDYFAVGCGVRVIAEPGRYFVTQAFELATNIIARRKVKASEMAAVEEDMMEVPQEDRPMTLYYINEGVYQSFSCIPFDHQKPIPHVMTLNRRFVDPGFFSGPAPVGLLTPEPSECSDSDAASMTSSTMSMTSITYPISEAATTMPPPPPHKDDLQPCKIFGPSCDSIDLVCPCTYLPVDRLDVGDWLRWKNMGAYTICSASQFNGFKISEVRYTVDAKGEEGIEEEVRRLIGGPDGFDEE